MSEGLRNAIQDGQSEANEVMRTIKIKLDSLTPHGQSVFVSELIDELDKLPVVKWYKLQE